MRKVQILAVAALAFRDAVRALNAMPALVLAIAIISAGVALGDWMFELSSETSAAPLSKTLLIKFVVGIVATVLLSPVFIAVYRFVILGEVSRGYSLDPNDPRFQLFSAWAVVIFLLAEYSSSVALALVPASHPLNLPLTFVLIGVTLVVTAWTALLFPAIAVDAPGVSWRNAMADMSGFFWPILAILILTVFPVLALAAIILQVAGDNPVVDAFVTALAGPASTLVWNAAAAKLYQELAISLIARST